MTADDEFEEWLAESRKDAADFPYPLPERPSTASLLHGTEFDGLFRPDLRLVRDDDQ